MTAASSPAALRRRLVVGALQAALLVAAAGATVAFVHRDHRVTVSVDGQARSVRTFSTTVHGALDAAGLTVGPHDVLTPAMGAHLAAGDTVVLQRGRQLHLDVDGHEQTVWTTATTVRDALTQLGLVRTGEYVSASRSREIGLGGAALSVRYPHRVVVVHDGQATPVVSTEPTVTALLADAHIGVGPTDVVSVPGATYPADDMTVQITRVAAGQLTDDEVVPQTTTHVPDGSIYVGTSTVTDPGTPGVIHDVYAVTYHDGQVVAKQLVSQTQTVAMRPRVVHDGTQPRPAPVRAVAPASSGASGLNWAALASCESGGDPTLVSGDGNYYGLYQFSLSTWQSVGGSGRPSDASSAEQTQRAELLYDRAGRSAWPTCGKYL